MKWFLWITAVIMFIVANFTHAHDNKATSLIIGFVFWTGFVVITEVQHAIREKKCTHS